MVDVKQGLEGKVRLSKHCSRGEILLYLKRRSKYSTDGSKRGEFQMCAPGQSNRDPALLVAEKTHERECEAPVCPWSLLTAKHSQHLSLKKGFAA